MTAHSLARIVSEELAAIGIVKYKGETRLGRVRHTVWSLTLSGFGIRYYGSGRKVYILQTTMAGKQRLITLGNASVLRNTDAIDVAKRILVRAQTGENPADTKSRIRSAPRFDKFLEEYWQKAKPNWKPSTLKAHNLYRKNYIGPAFAGKFVDEIDKADVLKWFTWVSDTGGPGAGNRALSILSAALTKAEQWGYPGTRAMIRHGLGLPAIRGLSSRTMVPRVLTALIKAEKALMDCPRQGIDRLNASRYGQSAPDLPLPLASPVSYGISRISKYP